MSIYADKVPEFISISHDTRWDIAKETGIELILRPAAFNMSYIPESIDTPGLFSSDSKASIRNKFDDLSQCNRNHFIHIHIAQDKNDTEIIKDFIKKGVNITMHSQAKPARSISYLRYDAPVAKAYQASLIGLMIIRFNQEAQ